MIGIILSVNAWMVTFMKKSMVEKVNVLYHFAVSIDIQHALGELVKEYSRRPVPDRRRYSTGTVDEDDKEVEEVDDDGTSVGNGEYNTDSVVEEYFQKIKKSEVDIYLNATDNNYVEEDNVNKKTQELSNVVIYDTSIDNGVDGSGAYDKFKELLICDSLDEANVCALKLMELLSLGKLYKVATSSAKKYKPRNERWFNQKQENQSKEEVNNWI